MSFRCGTVPTTSTATKATTCWWAGNQAFTINASKPFFTSPGDLWVEQGRGFSSVSPDIKGDGNTEMRIDVMGTTTLTASDFSV